jgi:hypothetical protein
MIRDFSLKRIWTPLGYRLEISDQDILLRNASEMCGELTRQKQGRETCEKS